MAAWDPLIDSWTGPLEQKPSKLQTLVVAWPIDTSQQARRRQRIAVAEEEPVGPVVHGDDGLEDRNEAANHAIRRVREKLNGYEDGTSGEQQTIEGQVRFLVRAARDLDDLSQMYPGWAPWM